jgi:hypothetical protein
MQLDECEVVGRELAVAGCHTLAVLDLSKNRSTKCKSGKDAD